MRLTDLDARFVDNATATGCHMTQANTVDGAQGVMFQCPRCAEGKEIVRDDEREGRRYVIGAHYVRVFFSNPRNASVAAADVDGNPRWEMSGTSLDDLTLSPSINLDVAGGEGGCKWHGYVKSGEAA